MEINFQRHHAAMLLKYSGISFIAGALITDFSAGKGLSGPQPSAWGSLWWAL